MASEPVSLDSSRHEGSEVFSSIQVWLRFPSCLRSLTPSDRTVVWLCVQSISCVQLFATSWTIHSPPGFFQARILEWVAVSFSRRSFWLRDWTHISSMFCVGRQILYHWATWEACSQTLKATRNLTHGLLWSDFSWDTVLLSLRKRLGSSIVLEIWSQKQTSIHRRLNIDLTKKRKKWCLNAYFLFCQPTSRCLLNT